MKLRFDLHIDAICKKAFRTLGFVIRTSRNFQRPETVIYLYNTLVRSQLEYASPIWSPHYKDYILRVERIQRRFTRYLFRKFHIPYLDYDGRLHVLGLQSLGLRRLVADGILLHKIVNGALITSVNREISIRVNPFNVRNMGLFGIKTHSINCAFFNILPRTMRLYNKIFGAVDILNRPSNDFKKVWTNGLESQGFTIFSHLLNSFTITT